MNNDQSKKSLHPPIVVVMGHVDHGKTALLDYIRKTNVVSKESGGITQHIGAYQIEHSGKLITFIDTPGHEAFSAIRARGATAADIAILVVAADEGVKQQTKEALKHILLSGIPYIVALNKMDKQSAKPDETKKQLADEKIYIEEYGGKIPLIPISAKTGDGVEQLLEMVLLVTELENLEAHPDEPAQGVIIESFMDQRRGSTGTFLIRDGTLKIGDALTFGGITARVKVIESPSGDRITEAGPSTPVILFGLPEVPAVGDVFFSGKTNEEAKDRAHAAQGPDSQSKRFQEGITKRIKKELPEGIKEVILLLKADVQGSLEALNTSIKKLKIPGISLKIIQSSSGPITESDIQSAESSNAIIISFRSIVSSQMRSRLARSGVVLLESDIIYELIEKIEQTFSSYATGLPEKKKEGAIQILAIFHGKKGMPVVGGIVQKGTVRAGMKVTIRRNDSDIASGVIEELQQQKNQVKSVPEGKECGMKIVTQGNVAIGDILIFPVSS